MTLDPQDVIDWIEIHLAGQQLTAEQKAILRLAYLPGGGSIAMAANATWRRYREHDGPTSDELQPWRMP